MARRCKELHKIHQIKPTIHCVGINLTNIRVPWDHMWLKSSRFLTSVVREMWSDRGDSMFYSLIGRSILINWAFAQQLGVLIPQRVKAWLLILQALHQFVQRMLGDLIVFSDCLILITMERGHCLEVLKHKVPNPNHRGIDNWRMYARGFNKVGCDAWNII